MPFWKQNRENVYVAAHRGWSAKYPVEGWEDIILNPYRYAYCTCMFRALGSGNATVEEYEAMRKLGVRTRAGASISNEATVEQAVLCGVELITSNNFDETLSILRSMGLHK